MMAYVQQVGDTEEFKNKKANIGNVYWKLKGRVNCFSFQIKKRPTQSSTSALA